MFHEKRLYAAHKLYADVFAVHARMNAFLIDFGERRGWALMASLLRIRYVTAFTAFLDQPTLSRFDAVLAFDDEMATVGASMPPMRPGYEQRRGDQT